MIAVKPFYLLTLGGGIREQLEQKATKTKHSVYDDSDYASCITSAYHFLPPATRFGKWKGNKKTNGN